MIYPKRELQFIFKGGELKLGIMQSVVSYPA